MNAMNRTEFVPQTSCSTAASGVSSTEDDAMSADVPSTALRKTMSYAAHMNVSVELKFGKFADDWSVMGEEIESAEIASERDCAQGENQSLRRKVAVLWREDNFMVPLQRSAGSS